MKTVCMYVCMRVRKRERECMSGPCTATAGQTETKEGAVVGIWTQLGKRVAVKRPETAAARSKTNLCSPTSVL